MYKRQVKNIAWDGIFAALASNQVDVIAASVSITDKRKKAMLFTDPYYELHQAVVLPLGKEIKDLEELAGKRVGGQIGTKMCIRDSLKGWCGKRKYSGESRVVLNARKSERFA